MNRSSTAFLICAAAILAGTVASGVVHGVVSQRWGAPAGLDEVGAAIERLPEKIGDWETREEMEPSDEVRRLLRCDGFVNRYYVNQRTGRVVELYVVLGPAGPVSVHQPEICFKNHAYKQRGERQQVTFSRGDREDSLWALTFDPSRTNLDGKVTRVYYGWSTGEEFHAPGDARLAFAGNPYLYKLQINALLPLSADLEENDPCREFVNDLLPVLESHLRSRDQL